MWFFFYFHCIKQKDNKNTIYIMDYYYCYVRRGRRTSDFICILFFLLYIIFFCFIYICTMKLAWYCCCMSLTNSKCQSWRGRHASKQHFCLADFFVVASEVGSNIPGIFARFLFLAYTNGFDYISKIHAPVAFILLFLSLSVRQVDRIVAEMNHLFRLKCLIEETCLFIWKLVVYNENEVFGYNINI